MPLITGDAAEIEDVTSDLTSFDAITTETEDFSEILIETLLAANAPPVVETSELGLKNPENYNNEDEASINDGIKADSAVSLSSVSLLSTGSIDRPLIFVPGLAGSFASYDSVGLWISNRGLHPNQLQLEPIANSYDDIIQTLENSGYSLNQDLFIANWDWRLAVAPSPQDVGESTGPVDLRIGEDLLMGGDGEDTIVGDGAWFVTPFMSGFPVEEADFQAAALEYQQFLFDLRHVVLDFSYVVDEAHLQVVQDLVSELPNTNPDHDKIDKKNAVDPDIHNLFIGNDIIDGGSENDTLIGDDASFIAPVVNGQRYEKAKDIGDIDKAVLKATEEALKDAVKIEDKAIEDHVDDHHPEIKKDLIDKKDLELLVWDWEYSLQIG